jgi:hypothetical protein
MGAVNHGLPPAVGRLPAVPYEVCYIVVAGSGTVLPMPFRPASR